MTIDLAERPSFAVRRAIRVARMVRRGLVRLHDDELGGDCGLASVLVALAIDDLASLRMMDKIGMCHVWNVVDDVIIDVTATQFNVDEPDPPVRGVLVTRQSRSYHQPIVGRGRRVLRAIARQGWYDDLDEPQGGLWQRAMATCGAGRGLVSPERPRPVSRGSQSAEVTW